MSYFNTVLPRIIQKRYLQIKTELQSQFKRRIIQSLLNNQSQYVYHINHLKQYNHSDQPPLRSKSRRKRQKDSEGKNSSQEGKRQEGKGDSKEEKNVKQDEQERRRIQSEQSQIEVVQPVQAVHNLHQQKSSSRLRVLKNKFKNLKNTQSRSKVTTIDQIQDYLPFDQNKISKHCSFKKSKILKIKGKWGKSIQLNELQQQMPERPKLEQLFNIRRAKTFKNNVVYLNNSSHIKQPNEAKYIKQINYVKQARQARQQEKYARQQRQNIFVKKGKLAKLKALQVTKVLKGWQIQQECYRHQF